MGFQHEFSLKAKDDLLEIISYYADKKGTRQTAERFNRYVFEKISLICENPYMYPVHHNERLALLGIRFATVWRYLILYITNENTRIVTILRIIHGKRDLNKIT